MQLKGSKTEQNLMEAFAGESQARNKYNFYNSQAKKEGYERIAAIFNETADQEKEHAKLWFKLLNGIGNTEENLAAAAAGEHDEYANMYKEFALVAKQEGFEDIARLFAGVGEIEKNHHDRYQELLKELKAGTVFVSAKEETWVCRNCGHHHIGKEALAMCPICSHPKAFFERLR